MIGGLSTICSRAFSTSVLRSFAVILLLGAVDAPSGLTRDRVNRALSGAEWLAERADAEVDRETASAASSLMDWLLEALNGLDANGDAFIAHLGTVGYGDPPVALSAWIEDMQALLQATEAADRDVRPIRKIERELEALPIVPLDAAGEAERRRLLEELALASYGAEERAAAAAAAARVDRLRHLVLQSSPGAE